MADEDVQNFGSQFSAICVLMNRPQLISGWFRDILIKHFQSGQHEHPELANLIWGDTERTSILIEPHTKWTPEMTSRRPAVIIKRNGFENVRMGIEDRMQSNPSIGAPEHYITFWTGSTTMFCIGETGAQAEVLGTEVQRKLTQFAPIIRKTLGLHRLRVLNVGEVHELEEYSDNYVVPVTAGYTFEESWEVTPEAPFISKISLSLKNLFGL
jgi:hypothetical protein